MGTSASRVWQALAVAALGVPGILLAHLLATGRAAGPVAAVAVTVAVAMVAAARPVRSTAGLALVTASSQVLGHAVLALAGSGSSASPGCLPVVGRGAVFGLHLALLRVDTTCPAGSFAPGSAAAPAAAALTAVLAALTVLAGHALAALATGIMLAAGGRAAQVARAVRDVAQRIAALGAFARPWRRLLAVLRILARAARTARAARSAARQQLGFAATGFRPVAPWSPGAVSLRGPPAPPRRAALGAPAWLTA